MFINQINVNGTDYDIIPTGSEMPFIIQAVTTSDPGTANMEEAFPGASYRELTPTFFIKDDNTVVLAAYVNN